MINGGEQRQMRSLSHWGWYQFISLMHLHGVLSLKDTDYWIPCLWGECVRRIHITYRDGEPPFILYHSCFLPPPHTPKCKCKGEQTCVHSCFVFLFCIYINAFTQIYHGGTNVFCTDCLFRPSGAVCGADKRKKNLEPHDKLLGIFPRFQGRTNHKQPTP